MHARTLTLIAALLLVTAPKPAHPCGAVFSSLVAQPAAVDGQRALIAVRGLELEVHLRMSARHDGAPFAWIVPVPETPALSLGDAAIFDALEAETQPSVTLPREATGGVGCGDAASGATGPEIRGATHFAGGALGDYTWDVVGGTSPEAVIGWLDQRGYHVPDGAEEVFGAYTERGMRFVAVRLDPDADRTEDALDPLVLTMTTPGDRRVRFPLGALALSAQAVNPVTVWVLADKRYRVANAASVSLDTVAGHLRGALDAGEQVSYAGAVDALTAEGGGRLFVTEYARSLEATDGPLAALTDAEAFYLTRLSARIPSDALDDAIITFANDAPDVSPHATAAAPIPLAGALAAGWPIALLGVLVWRRRYRKPGLRRP